MNSYKIWAQRFFFWQFLVLKKQVQKSNSNGQRKLITLSIDKIMNRNHITRLIITWHISHAQTTHMKKTNKQTCVSNCSTMECKQHFFGLNRMRLFECAETQLVLITQLPMHLRCNFHSSEINHNVYWWKESFKKQTFTIIANFKCAILC